MNKGYIRLSLGIISGRIDAKLLSNEHYMYLGFDPSKIDFHSKQAMEELEIEVRRKSEEMVLNILCPV